MGAALSYGREQVLETLQAHADSPSAFLALNEGTRYFSTPGKDGFIAYRAQGGYLFQIGGVVASAAQREFILGEFLAYAQKIRKQVCAVQLRQEDVALYGRHGFKINQLGLSYSLDVTAFKTAGTRFLSMRNKIKRAQKAGVEIKEIGRDVPFDAKAKAALDDITDAWLKAKGKKKLLEFMVGDLAPTPQPCRRIFSAWLGDTVLGFISYVPSYGQLEGMMHDLTRRRHDAPPGVMELINVQAIERFRAEGLRYLNFGLTPFCGLSAEHDNHPTRSAFLSWLIGSLEKHGKAVYPAQAQVQYKKKWQPMLVTPEYVGFHRGFRLSGLFRLLQLTRTI
jgi:phosphatidylglycerol lysyltransferase